MYSSVIYYYSSIFVIPGIFSRWSGVITPGIYGWLLHYSNTERYSEPSSLLLSGVSPYGMGFPRRSKNLRAGFWSSASASACTRSITGVGTGRGVKACCLMRRPIRRLRNQWEPWRFPVGTRHIVGSVRDCVEFCGIFFRVPWRMHQIRFCSVY